MEPSCSVSGSSCHELSDKGREKRAMRLLLLTGVCVVLISGTALACRGTTEYPQLTEQLQSSTMSPERLTDLLEQLNLGAVMHEDAHREGDMAKMGESIRLLDAMKEKLGE